MFILPGTACLFAPAQGTITALVNIAAAEPLHGTGIARLLHVPASQGQDKRSRIIKKRRNTNLIEWIPDDDAIPGFETDPHQAA